METVDRTVTDNRVFINGVLWIPRSGAMARYFRALRRVQGRAQAVQPIAASGMWNKIFGDLVANRKTPYPMIDSTFVRANQQVATRPKKGADKALGVPKVD